MHASEAIQPNQKILTAIVNRATARASARDIEGLRAILAAAERGRELAAQALATLEAPAPQIAPPRPARASVAPRESTPVLESSLAGIVETERDRPRKLAAPKPLEEEKHEKQIIEKHVSRETSEFFSYIMDQGGVRPSSDDLTEEYSVNVPPSYRRPNGMPGDELADQMRTDRPEYGIASENELLEFFGARRRMARDKRALATA